MAVYKKHLHHIDDDLSIDPAAEAIITGLLSYGRRAELSYPSFRGFISDRMAFALIDAAFIRGGVDIYFFSVLKYRKYLDRL